MAEQAPLEMPFSRRCSAKVKADHPVYELDLWLDGSDPPVWRSLGGGGELTAIDRYNDW
ncbi:MAG: hypothetical protein WD042_11970 [Phycisphaeraceae bacterium]